MSNRQFSRRTFTYYGLVAAAGSILTAYIDSFLPDNSPTAQLGIYSATTGTPILGKQVSLDDIDFVGVFGNISKLILALENPEIFNNGIKHFSIFSKTDPDASITIYGAQGQYELISQLSPDKIKVFIADAYINPDLYITGIRSVTRNFNEVAGNYDQIISINYNPSTQSYSFQANIVLESSIDYSLIAEFKFDTNGELKSQYSQQLSSNNFSISDNAESDAAIRTSLMEDLKSDFGILRQVPDFYETFGQDLK